MVKESVELVFGDLHRRKDVLRGHHAEMALTVLKALDITAIGHLNYVSLDSHARTLAFIIQMSTEKRNKKPRPCERGSVSGR
jgi:hypothetical protein